MLLLLLFQQQQQQQSIANNTSNIVKCNYARATTTTKLLLLASFYMIIPYDLKWSYVCKYVCLYGSCGVVVWFVAPLLKYFFVRCCCLFWRMDGHRNWQIVCLFDCKLVGMVGEVSNNVGVVANCHRSVFKCLKSYSKFWKFIVQKYLRFSLELI